MFRTGSMVWVLGHKEARVGLILELHKGSKATVRVAGHGAIVVPIRRLRLMTKAAHVEGVMKYVVVPQTYSKEDRSEELNTLYQHHNNYTNETNQVRINGRWVWSN